MAIEVVPHADRWTPAVRQFNARMEAGGVHWRWYEDPVDYWIPERHPGQKVWREHYLAVENGETVRAGFVLKPHEFLCRGKPEIVTDWQGPITEAVLDRRHAPLMLRLLRDMLRRYPLLYSWGHGEGDQPMLQVLRSLGWLLHPTPFCLRVTRPARFLRRNRYLRTTPLRRLGQDLLAASGAGSVGLGVLHAALRVQPPRVPRTTAEIVPVFGAWADDLWESARACYSLVAARDAATMNLLVPETGWPAGIRLRVSRAGRTVGWAVVLDTQMNGDARFGEMRVGTIADVFGHPDEAPGIVGAAFRFLRDRGVDMVFANQSHPGWIRGFAANGFVILPGRRLLAASPDLARALDPIEETAPGIHMTNMDGHGPILL